MSAEIAELQKQIESLRQEMALLPDNTALLAELRKVVSARAAVDKTASRALNTTYTNTGTQPLMVQASVRCAVTLAGGNAFVQGAAPVGTAATGLIGIETGLLGEDNSFQLVFVVNPGANYRINSSAVNGTTTLGNWFEFPL